MINVQVSANPQSITYNSCEVYWNVELPVKVASQQLRPTNMRGVIKIEAIKFKTEPEILAYAELKALNALFCYEQGLLLLTSANLRNGDFHFLCSSELAVEALRGHKSQFSDNEIPKLLINVATPIATMFFGAKFNRIVPFLLEHEDVKRFDEFSAGDISDIICIDSEIGLLSISRRTLESFTRKTKRDNAFYELAGVLQSSKLTLKFMSPQEREDRIAKNNFDCEIVLVESDDPTVSGLHFLIPKKPFERNGMECYSIITLFNESVPQFGNKPKPHGKIVTANLRKDNPMTNQIKTNSEAPQASQDSRYVPEIMYVEVNQAEKMVSVQFGSVVTSIDLYESPLLELNYVDAAFMAINLIQIECQPQKRVRIFTNHQPLVDAFQDLESVTKYVVKGDKVTNKLYERIALLMYKVRLFGNLKLSNFALRPVPVANEQLAYSKINFDSFGKVRQGRKLLILTPHAFAAFLNRMSPEEIATGGRNPLAYFNKMIKNGKWEVVLEADEQHNEQWYNKETNSLIVIGTSASDNSLQIVTFWRGHRYERYDYKLEHPERFHEVEVEVAEVQARSVKIID